MKRRKLNFEKLEQAVAECHRLLDSGYQKAGKWSLADACEHIRLTIESNMQGYPWWMSLAAPIRPIMRAMMLPRLLRGDSPAGLPTAGMFVPSGNATDRDEVEAFEKCVDSFRRYDGKLYPHPGFGSMSKDQFEHFHASHMAHHLGFLLPGQIESTPTKAEL